MMNVRGRRIPGCYSARSADPRLVVRPVAGELPDARRAGPVDRGADDRHDRALQSRPRAGSRPSRGPRRSGAARCACIVIAQTRWNTIPDSVPAASPSTIADRLVVRLADSLGHLVPPVEPRAAAVVQRRRRRITNRMTATALAATPISVATGTGLVRSVAWPARTGRRCRSSRIRVGAVLALARNRVAGLARRALHPRLDVGLGRQQLDRLTQLGPGPPDLRAQHGRIGRTVLPLLWPLPLPNAVIAPHPLACPVAVLVAIVAEAGLDGLARRP